ncbi:hypothetical protein JCM19238_5143 [Vibrio ponticus]|nr:hypothetical protein JCM19238_5143 [Vibrio ponticus]
MKRQTHLDDFEQHMREVFHMSDEEWQVFVEQGSLKAFSKGETLFIAGDIVDKVRFVCQGTLCNFYLTTEAFAAINHFCNKGIFLPAYRRLPEIFLRVFIVKHSLMACVSKYQPKR